jgi:UDP-2-acetamido-3-amino-2,3-dideoxy-glucuronate N-acetyltransferase
MYENSFVDSSVKIGKNSSIGNFISIFQDVVIGSNVKIDDGARIYDGCKIGDNSVIGANAVLRPKTIIGKNTIFGPLSECDGNSTIGDNTTIHAHCQITWGSIIGNNCFIGSYFMSSNTKDISNGEHGTSKNKKSANRYPPIIKDNVRIGIKVSLIPNIVIEHDSLIYQNCLITKNVPSYSIIKAGKDQVGVEIGKN